MSINNIGDIEKALRLEDGALSAAISNEEGVDIALPVLKTFTDDEHAELLSNFKKEHKVTGVEMAVKEARDEHGLDFQGKTIGNLLDAFKAKSLADSSKEPNEIISGLQADKAALQEAVTGWDTKYTTLQTEHTQEKERSSINELISSKISAKGDYTIPLKDAVTIFKANHSFEKLDGLLVFKDIQGEVIKDERRTPVTIDSMVDAWAPTYIKQNTGGRGGEDEAGKGGDTSFESFAKRMENEGIIGGSETFNKRMSDEVNNGTLKM